MSQSIAIPLLGKNGWGEFAFIDEDDLELISPFRWRGQRNISGVYAVASLSGSPVFMHRLIASAGSEHFVDHLDHDTLNNRRENLRICTKGENNCNRVRNKKHRSSRFKGVSRLDHLAETPWQAQIGVEGRLVYIGVFFTEEDAARAYNAAAIRYHGGFAFLNEIPGMSREESCTPPSPGRSSRKSVGRPRKAKIAQGRP